MFARLFIRSFVGLSVRSFVCSFVRMFVPFARLFALSRHRSLLFVLIHSFVCSLAACSFVYLIVRPCVCSLRLLARLFYRPSRRPTGPPAWRVSLPGPAAARALLGGRPIARPARPAARPSGRPTRIVARPAAAEPSVQY